MADEQSGENEPVYLTLQDVLELLSYDRRLSQLAGK
jgi:hypothetical protein